MSILADLHIHSNYSDGSDTIENLLTNIEKSNISVFSLTDHDTIAGAIEIEKFVPSHIKYIRGVELTCKTRDIKCHILGYNYQPNDIDLHNLILKGKELRRQKLETRIKYLKEVWNIELTKEELDWLYSRPSVVKTHFANILVKRGLADDNLSAMRKYLDGCKTGNTRFDGEEAINIILNAGGIPVWAHPLGGEGEKHLSEDEFLSRLNTMMECGIKGLECYYSRYNNEEISFLVDCANKYNLLISGGSDYHGSNKKNITIGKLNVDNRPVYCDKLTIISNLPLE